MDVYSRASVNIGVSFTFAAKIKCFEFRFSEHVFFMQVRFDIAFH